MKSSAKDSDGLPNEALELVRQAVRNAERAGWAPAGNVVVLLDSRDEVAASIAGGALRDQPAFLVGAMLLSSALGLIDRHPGASDPAEIKRQLTTAVGDPRRPRLLARANGRWRVSVVPYPVVRAHPVGRA